METPVLLHSATQAMTKKIKETKQLKSAFLYISVGYNSIIISFAEEKAATWGNEMLN